MKYWMLEKKMDLNNVNTSEIITFNTIALKGAIRDVGRGLGMPLAEVDEIAKAVHEESVDEIKIVTIDESWRKKYPELFRIVDIVNGTIVSIGSHPSGVLVTDRNIEEEIGICTLSGDPYPVSFLDMKELDSLNYVKEDLLGLDNVEIINNTCKMAGIDRLSPKTINFEDDNVWNSMCNDTSLIFQMNSSYGQMTINKMFQENIIKKIKKSIPNISRLDLLTFINALIRPCGKGVYDNATKGIVFTTGIQEIDELLAPSMGYAIMQEPQMSFVQKFCGYSFLESDALRKCVAGGTKITMGDESLKNIEDISVGDRVISFDGVNFIPKTVTNVFDNGIKNTIKLRFQNGYDIICTPDHKLLTSNGWKEAQNISNEDLVYSHRKISCGTNEFLNGNFMYSRLISIEKYEEVNVYDIEVEDTHNFIANGIVAHNCVAKKKGTREQLPKIKEGFENNAKVRFNLTQEKSDEVIEPFLQCILDATRYSFSLVHSLSYSCISYECAYLRYYYPLEYLTCCLNTWIDKDEKSEECIEYINKNKIGIRPPRFRYSKSEYFFDENKKCIYKGTNSVKFLNDGVSVALYDMRDNKYDTFTDLLYSLNDTDINSRQLEILIRIGYFKEFGNSKELMRIYNNFTFFKSGLAKTVSKSKIENDRILFDIVSRNSNQTEKQFNKINCRNILLECEEYIRSLNIPDFSYKDKIIDELEYMGYIGIQTGEKLDRPKLIVLDKKNMISKADQEKKIWGVNIQTQSIGSGIKNSFTIPYAKYKREPIDRLDIIYVNKCHKNYRNYWYIDDYYKVLE